MVNEIIHRRKDAAEIITNIYKTYEGETVNDWVTSIESLPIVREKIDQFKQTLQSKIKEFNDNNF